MLKTTIAPEGRKRITDQRVHKFKDNHHFLEQLSKFELTASVK